jgi:hypothetical protein
MAETYAGFRQVSFRFYHNDFHIAPKHDTLVAYAPHGRYRQGIGVAL